MKREARSERRGRENVTRRRRKKATRESRRKKRRRDEGKKKERKKTRSRQVILQVIQDASCTRYKNSKSFPFSFSLSLSLPFNFNSFLFPPLFAFPSASSACAAGRRASSTQRCVKERKNCQQTRTRTRTHDKREKHKSARRRVVR